MAEASPAGHAYPMAELFPDADYRFQMNLERGSVRDYFQATKENRTILVARRLWLDSEPGKYAALLDEGWPLLDESIEVLQQAGAIETGEADRCRNKGSSWNRCLEFGRILEPDFLLLIPQPISKEDGPLRLVGASVCFPSSWSLAEKIGRPLEFIHHVVPGLNQQIGLQISRFLSPLKPGAAWLRANWGLSRSGEWNQHPDRKLPPLDEFTRFEEIWLRIERQALVLLPRSSGVLFGIRIETHPLTELMRSSADARGLARALRTMPESVAQYKKIAAVRESVARELES